MMTKRQLAIIVSGLVAMFTAAAAPGDTMGIGAVGARYHTDHSAFEGLPYGDGDISVGAAYEWHEEAGYWQVAVDYAPVVRGSSTNASADYIVTPQLNLILSDRMWRGGAGVLSSYLGSESGASDWTPFYWQLLAGLNLPLHSRVYCDVFAYYVLEQWNEIKLFDWRDLEVGLWLGMSF